MLSRFSAAERWGLRFVYAPAALFSLLLTCEAGHRALDRNWPLLMSCAAFGLGYYCAAGKR